jgi:LacI family transcriptional regulator
LVLTHCSESAKRWEMVKRFDICIDNFSSRILNMSIMKRYTSGDSSPTLKDVAAKAGVSLATASYALNGNGRVTPETRARVREVATSMGYAPSLAARALKGGTGKTILIMADGLAGPWYGELLEGLQLTFVAEGYAVLASTLGDNALSLCRGLILDGFVAGVVVLNPGAARLESLARLLGSKPSVLFDADESYHGSIRFAVDNRGGIRAMARHLWDKGCRSFLWLDGNLDDAWDARERWEAFAEFLGEKSPVAFTLERAYGGFNAPKSKAAVERMLDNGARPRAIVAANDESAFGALQALSSRGFRVPRDVMVTGFDGLDGSAWTDPPLTTLSFDRRALGQRMARCLVGQLKNSPEDVPVQIIPVELVVRATT